MTDPTPVSPHTPASPQKKRRGTAAVLITAAVVAGVLVVGVGGYFAVQAVGVLTGQGSGSGEAADASPATLNGTTEYAHLPGASTDPISSRRVVIELPAAEGFDGGRTVISTPQDSAWDWYEDKLVDNNNLYSRQMGAVYGGFGLCTSTVAFVRDSGDNKDRWAFSDQVYAQTVVDFFRAALGVQKPGELQDDALWGTAYHQEGLGQIPFFRFTVPASKNNTLADMKVLEGPDYNTGYITFLTVACQGGTNDTQEVFDLMTEPGNKFSVYVDVLPKE